MELLETKNHIPKGDITMIPQKQLSLADIFEDCKNIHDSDKPQFLSLLEKHINLDEIIPTSFFNHYYAATGKNRKYPLTAMLTNLVLPPMNLVLSVPLISTTRIILLPILILLLKRNQNLQMKTNLLLTQKLYCLH